MQCPGAPDPLAAAVTMRVQLSNIRAGSVIVDTTVQFLVEDGNTKSANALASTLLINPASVLPASAWGSVMVTEVTRVGSYVHVCVVRGGC